MVALGTAGSEHAEQQLQKLGNNLVWIEAGSRNIAGVRTGSHGTQTLTPEDVEAIAAEIPLIRSVSPQVDGNAMVAYGNRNWTTHYRGVSPEFLDIRQWEAAEGTMYRQGEGVEKDEGRAVQLLQRGCDGGLDEACAELRKR